MRIVACLKQVPGVSEVKMDPVTKRLLREGAAAVLNPFDYYALEAAVRLKESGGAEEIVVLTMGPPKAEAVLREALAFGADRAVLLSDRRFAGSDTWATSYALALAIRKIGDVGVVLCGRQAVDGDTAQTPPGIAAQLGWSQAACVSELELSSGGLKVKRATSVGFEICELRLPSVLSAAKDLDEPRVPRLAGWLRAVDAGIETWNAEDLGADAASLGLSGSPTRVVKTFAPPPRRSSSRILDGPAELSAQVIAEALQTVAKI